MNQICTFVLEDRLFGLPVSDVREVLNDGQVHEIPLAPPLVSGLLNLRGRVISALDIRGPLCLEPSDAPATTHVIVEHGTQLVSLLVHGVEDVITFEDGAERALPPAHADSRLIEKVYTHDESFVCVLSPERIVNLHRERGNV